MAVGRLQHKQATRGGDGILEVIAGEEKIERAQKHSGVLASIVCGEAVMTESNTCLGRIAQLPFHDQLAHREIAESRPEFGVFVGALRGPFEDGGGLFGAPAGAVDAVKHLVGLDIVR